MGKAENIISQVLERMLPVGSIVEWSPVDGGKADLSSADKVAAYYGFGTWEAYGNGSFLLGVSDIHAVGSTGGEEQHWLTEAEVPLHSHHFLYNGQPKSPTLDMGISDSAFGLHYSEGQSSYRANPASSYDSSNFGGNGPHNNMPPFITVYRWRRIA